MKKLFVLVVVLLVAAMIAFASAADTQVYTASANAYGGELTVEVTIEDDKIADVALGENHETNVVIDRAFPVIRERILEANSPEVDSVSGATFSTYAVKLAVADAMKQAGMQVGEIARVSDPAQKPAAERGEEQCDIVIVGGGPAGLAAAVSAKQTQEALHVIVVE